MSKIDSPDSNRKRTEKTNTRPVAVSLSNLAMNSSLNPLDGDHLSWFFELLLVGWYFSIRSIGSGAIGFNYTVSVRLVVVERGSLDSYL